MWLNIKIGMFYGAPVLAVLLALAAFVVLLLQVRRRRISRRQAVLRYLWALLLPAGALLLIVLTGELAGYFSSSVARYAWDSDRTLGLLTGLLPLGMTVAAAVGVLQLLFWMVLLLLHDAREGCKA